MFANIVVEFLLTLKFRKSKTKKSNGIPFSIPFLIFISLFVQQSLADSEQFVLNAEVKNIYQKSLQLEFEQATQLLESKTMKANAFRHLLHNQIAFLQLFITEDFSAYEHHSKIKSSRIIELDRADHQSPFYYYSLAEINLQWAMLRLKFNDRMKAVIELKRAYNHLSNNQKLYPSFSLNLKLSALLNAFAGAVPENYKWLSDLIGFRGTVEEGLHELALLQKHISNNSSYDFLLPELIFFETFIDLNLSNQNPNYKAYYQKIEQLKYKSSLLNFCGASVAAKEKNKEKLSYYLNDVKSTERFCYLIYLKGIQTLNAGKKDAAPYFHRYFNCFKGQSYIKATYQKLAWIALLKQDTLSYRSFMLLALKEGNSDLDEDKMALFDAQKNTIPNVDLLRCRLHFDDGDYKAAYEILDDLKTEDFISYCDVYEYNYRKGRLLHMMDSLDQALIYYENTFKQSNVCLEYYGASAAYQTGIIFLHQKNYKNAHFWFNQCIAQKNHPFKNSLDAKAKVALEKIKSK